MGARGDALIRVDTIWLGLEPLDMRAGTESALARVVSAFGAAPRASWLCVSEPALRSAQGTRL